MKIFWVCAQTVQREEMTSSLGFLNNKMELLGNLKFRTYFCPIFIFDNLLCRHCHWLGNCMSYCLQKDNEQYMHMYDVSNN